MSKTIASTVVTLTAILVIGSSTAYADHSRLGHDGTDIWLGIAAAVFANEVTNTFAGQRDRHHRRDKGYGGNSDTEYNRGHSHAGRNFTGNRGGRHDFAASYTSEPIRGGSSRRTRVIENPYPNRPLTGITFTGIDRDAVHINDVISYPRKRLLSHRGYSLSLHHPSRHLNARGYVDYISVKAKRKEYFTVTFHYQ